MCTFVKKNKGTSTRQDQITWLDLNEPKNFGCYYLDFPTPLSPIISILRVVIISWSSITNNKLKLNVTNSGYNNFCHKITLSKLNQSAPQCRKLAKNTRIFMTSSFPAYLSLLLWAFYVSESIYHKEWVNMPKMHKWLN